MKPAQYLQTHPLPFSYLPISLTASLSNLAQKLNEKNDSLHINGQTEDGKYNYDLSVADTIDLASDEKQLLLSIPVNVLLTGVSNNNTINATVKLQVGTTAQLTSDWHIQTQSSLLGFDWITKPELDSAGNSIDISLVSDILMPLFSKQLLTQVDTTISQSDMLSEQVEAAWEKLQTDPQPIPDSDLKLEVNLKNAMASPLKLTMDAMNIDAQAVAQIMLLSPSAGDLVPAKPLPALETDQQLSSDSEIHIYAFLNYADLQNQLNNLMRGKSFDVSGRDVVVDDIQIQSDGQTMTIVVDVSGGVKGQATLKGSPYYNPETSIFEIRNVDFDFHTSNLLMRAAGSLFNNTIQNKVKEMSRINVDEQLRKNIPVINSKIQTIQMEKGFVGHAKINSLKVNNLDADADGIHFMASATGTMQLSY